MNITIVGTGYVGLVTAACFANVGHDVIGVDIDDTKVTMLKNGEIPIYEPQLKELVIQNQKEKRLQFTTSLKEGIQAAEVVFLCLPTMPNPDGSADLSHIKSVCRSIAKEMKQRLIIVNKSTAPVGTAHQIEKWIDKELSLINKSIEFDIVSNPEFLKEGAAVDDCMRPDRIIIGSNSTDAIQVMRKLYKAFSMNHPKMLIMTLESAELTKYAANVALASRISLMNELSLICEKTGASIHDVRIGIGADKRIGHHFLYAGIGYGGSCFPKDIKALKELARELGIKTPMLQAIEDVNTAQKRLLAEKIMQTLPPPKTIAIWGLSFKPDTDDIREAPSITIINTLLEQGYRLKLYDPIASQAMQKLIVPSDSLQYCKSAFDAAEDADAIALVTEWKQFRNIDMKKLASTMRMLYLFDGRNQYDKQEMQSLGFQYHGIGV